MCREREAGEGGEEGREGGEGEEGGGRGREGGKGGDDGCWYTPNVQVFQVVQRKTLHYARTHTHTRTYVHTVYTDQVSSIYNVIETVIARCTVHARVRLARQTVPTLFTNHSTSATLH